MRSHLNLLLLFSFIVACCAPAVQEPEPVAEATTEADVEAINTAGEEFVAAAKANSVEGLVFFYAADAVLMPPNEPAANGSEGVQEWMQSFFDRFTMEDFSISTEEVVVVGDWAFRRGTFAMSVTPAAGGEQVQDAGKFVEIWQRQTDGPWKMARDIWNSDNPPPGQ
ncbi:MAG: YybH family protein [Acidobacteriota bacterium]